MSQWWTRKYNVSTNKNHALSYKQWFAIVINEAKRKNYQDQVFQTSHEDRIQAYEIYVASAENYEEITRLLTRILANNGSLRDYPREHPIPEADWLTTGGPSFEIEKNKPQERGFFIGLPQLMEEDKIDMSVHHRSSMWEHHFPSLLPRTQEGNNMSKIPRQEYWVEKGNVFANRSYDSQTQYRQPEEKSIMFRTGFRFVGSESMPRLRGISEKKVTQHPRHRVDKQFPRPAMDISSRVGFRTKASYCTNSVITPYAGLQAKRHRSRNFEPQPLMNFSTLPNRKSPNPGEVMEMAKTFPTFPIVRNI